jgi:outer membrane protein TolC
LGIFAIVFFCNPADVAVKVAERIYRPPETALRELIDYSQHVYDLTRDRNAAGTGTLEAMIDAHRRLVKRKLDGCVNSEERVEVWKGAANTAQEIADDQASRYEAGSATEVDKIEGSEYQKEVELELAKSKFEAQQ